jgi:hypothetical protein
MTERSDDEARRLSATSRAMRALRDPDNVSRVRRDRDGNRRLVVVLDTDTITSVNERVTAVGGTATVVVDMGPDDLRILDCILTESPADRVDHAPGASMAMLVALLDQTGQPASTREVAHDHLLVSGGQRLLAPA